MNPYIITLHTMAQAAYDAQAMVSTWIIIGVALMILAAWAMVTAPEDPYGCPCSDCTPDRITTQEHFPDAEEWRHG